ncbi:DNA adenine methylase [Bacillus pumilus]|uniref:DNA adenine methylase n=1 Tax=Bacillus TaxID=1386 RepID=UPI000D043E62|nr:MULTISPECIES: DNA adenine methylase [Bacillus]MDG4730054.1 DNA adenine methylase [Bacillus pumilus]PRS38238.1 hypothetical protein C6Y02_12850 [Bacillus sp. NMCC4]PRS45963.1 hypothetical protein C6Y00_17890 [Bacillus sp. GBSC66]
MNFKDLKAVITSHLENEYSKFDVHYTNTNNSFTIDKYVKRIIRAYDKQPDQNLDDIILEVLNLNEYNIYKDFYGIKNNLSPLRYPGAKSKVLSKFVKYFKTPHIEYREPFVGGGSIFLGKHIVDKNILNDKDYNVYAFLTTIKDYPDLLCEKILNTQPTIELWLEKRFNSTQSTSDLDIAFDFLFFNRTNYSGIYSANPLGGIEQKSKYTIDCRWNAERLCSKIKKMSERLKSVSITNLDFEEIIKLPGENVLLVIDPPYYKKGNSLYTSKMTHEDHLRLAETLKNTTHKYLLTIDDSYETRKIYTYENTFINQESWKYTVHSKKNDNIGKELFISNFPIN